MSRYKRLGYGFLNKLKLEPRFLKHIILTQRVESYKPNHLNNFFNCMRRFYKDLVYIWTVEVQEERFEKYGDRVLHWHVLVGFPKGQVFGREDVLRIQKYWKYGGVQIIPVRHANVGYLMKYIQKALDVVSEDYYKIRKIGSSLIPAWLRQSWNDLTTAMNVFRIWGRKVEDMALLTWVRGNGYLVMPGERVLIYEKPKSKWFKVASLDCDDPCTLF